MEAAYWLGGMVVLLLIEAFTMGLTTIWFAGGALAAFLVALLGGGWLIELIVFLTVSFVLLFSTRPLAVKYLNQKRIKTNTDSLIGQEVKVIGEINNFNQTGTVVVNGLEWSARSENDVVIGDGSRVIIQRIEGVKLIVKEKEEAVC